jgi:hypothetical protein
MVVSGAFLDGLDTPSAAECKIWDIKKGGVGGDSKEESRRRKEVGQAEVGRGREIKQNAERTRDRYTRRECVKGGFKQRKLTWLLGLSAGITPHHQLRLKFT